MVCDFFVAAAMSAAVASADQLVPTITLIPLSGNVAGAPGTAVGWGFTLTFTNAADWVLLTGSEFTGSQVNGTYVDYLSEPTAPLYVAGPAPESSIVNQVWNASSSLGVAEFDIFNTANPGLITGNINIHYSVFSQDPNSPTFDPGSVLVADAFVTDQASVDVLPEPATAGLILAGMLTLGLGRFRIR